MNSRAEAEEIEIEPVGAELVPAPSGDGTTVPVSKMDAILELADKSDKISAALVKIRKLVLSQAAPGDFTIHGEKACCGSAGAERMRGLVGLGFVNWKKEKSSWDDEKGKAFTWWYSCDLTLNGSIVMENVEGRASSRDKFFGFENGAWKELSDVKEDDIRMAAYRACKKEGVLSFLGLRSLPNDPAYLEKLGLDPSKIKEVSRGKRGETATKAAPEGTPLKIKDVKAFNGTNKKTKKPYTRFDVFDTQGAKYSTFDKKVAEFARDKKNSGDWVLIRYEAGKFGNDIIEIAPSEPPKADAEPEA